MNDSGQPPPRKLGRSASLYLALLVAQRLSSFLLLPFVTRTLLPQEFGSIAILVAVGGLSATVLGSAIETAVFRAAALSDFPTLVLCQLYAYYILPAVGLVVALLMLSMSWSVAGVDAYAWGCELFSVVLGTAILGFALPALRARDALRMFAVVALVTIAASVGSRIYLILVLDRGVRGWAEADLLSSVGAFALCVATVRFKTSEMPPGTLSRLAVFVIPMIPHRMAFWALGSLDRVALGLVASLHEVGVYALAATFAAAVTAVIAEINHSVLVEYAQAKPPLPPPRLASIARWQILLAFAVPTIAIFGVLFLRAVLVSPSYDGAIAIFAILMVGQVAYGCYLIPMNLLTQTRGITGVSWIGSTAGAAVVFLGAYMFGARWGAYAIAIATCIGYVVMLGFAVALFKLYAVDVRWQTMSIGRLPTVLLSSALFISLFSGLYNGMAWPYAVIGLTFIIVATRRQFARRN